MKTRTKKDYNQNWVQTAVSIIGLLFAVAVGFGWVTPEQSAEALPVVTSTLTAVSAVIAGVIAIIGILFKPDEPTV
jgi:RsiW-degrading membrane proteinase PrsW (M82 family)